MSGETAMFKPGKRLLSTLLVASFLVLVALVGCSQVANVQLDPRDRLVLPPKQTQTKYGCNTSTKVMLQLEETWVLPEAVNPGNEVTHRIRYAFCHSMPSGPFKGSIMRTVLFKGKKLLQTITDYEFKPGTWIVEAFVGIPQETKNGAYALEVVLKYTDQTAKDTKAFIVRGN